MNALLLLAAVILGVVGVAHTYLGERYILIRLFRRTDLPKVWGSDVHTRRILRFAWHITTIAWWGLGAILIAAARPAAGLPIPLAGRIIALTSLASALMVLCWSRGRHLAWVAFLAVAVLVWVGVGCARAASPFVVDKGHLRRAIATNDCRLVDKVFFVRGETDAEREFLWSCWRKRQREIVSVAIARGDCRSVLTLPGIYPLGSDAEKRYVYHCWIRAKKGDLDTCIGMAEVGDASSRDLIVSVLKRNPPERMPEPSEQKFALIDTAGACLSALKRIDGLTDDQLKARASGWGPAWSEWSREPGAIFPAGEDGESR